MLSEEFLNELKGINSIEIVFLFKENLVFRMNTRKGKLIFSSPLNSIETYNLPEVHLFEKDFIYPHVYNRNKDSKWICYAEIEAIKVYDLSLEDKILFMIKSLKDLFNLYDYEIVEEFQKEFLVLWNNKSTLKAISYVKPEETFKKVEVYFEGENQKKYFKDYEEEIYTFPSDLVKEKEAFFIPLERLEETILPPNAILWDKDYLKNFIKKCTNKDMLHKLSKVLLRKKIEIIFYLPVENSIPITIGVAITFPTRSSKQFIKKLEECEKIQLINVERRDLYYLQNRVGNSIKNLEKKILLVGLGSVGSQVALELLRNGYNDLTLVDPDKFEVGNIARHILPEYLCGFPKVIALGSELRRRFPQSKIKTINKKIEKSGVIFSNYDIIIFSVGSNDLQRQYNVKLKKINYEGIVIFSWLEAGGERGHALKVSYQFEGCYECIFDLNGKNLLDSDKEVKRLPISNLCGGTFAPYGNVSVLKVILLVMELLKQNDHENSLISWIDNKIIKQDLIKLRGNSVGSGCDVCG